jgi:hypothetical protein
MRNMLIHEQTFSMERVPANYANSDEDRNASYLRAAPTVAYARQPTDPIYYGVAMQSETVSALVERFYRGEWPSKVTVREGAEKWALDPRTDLRTHSSAGFAWENGQSNGAHQLALALLADALEDDARASQLHRDFCSRVVAIFPKRWTISRSRIVAHAAAIEARHRGAVPS